MDQLFLDRLQILLGERYSEAVDSFEHDKLPSFRVNTLVISESEGIDVLQSNGFEIETVHSLPNAYLVKNKSKREFTDFPQYSQGWYYLQSFSSMVPVFALGDLTGRLHALDMCAAPGSKTSQLAAVLDSRGLIDAYDLSRQRIFQMKAVLSQLHVKNVYIHQSDASGIWRKYGPVFDVVLLDAVCSGEGRFKTSEPKTYADWELRKVKKMVEIQKRLLFSGIMCLKPGGVLIYSTCTFSPEENEGIIHFALQKFEGAIDIEPIDLRPYPPARSFVPGTTEWQGEIYDERISRAIRIVPDTTWDGFFVCRIKRN